MRCISPVLAVVVMLSMFASGAFAQRVRYDDSVVVTVTPRTTSELLAVTSLADSLWSHRTGVGAPTDIQITREKLDALTRMGVPAVVRVADLQAAIDAEAADIAARAKDKALANKDLAWFQNYKTTAEINAYLDGLVAAYPTLASSFVVGNSVQGQPIRGVRITGPGSVAARPAVLLNGTQHAREWISPMTVTYLADQLLAQYAGNPRVRTLVDRMEFFIVPVVNPDGYDYSWTTDRLWRKNRRNNGDGTFGVDLNRNWPVGWGGTGSSGTTSSDVYRGTAALSEPEALALSQFIIANPRLVTHIDFHSYSQLVLWPYSYGPVDPPQPDLGVFQTLGGLVRAAILGVNGVSYVAQRSADLYSSGGDIIDWSYESRGHKALTVELRPSSASPGFLLPADQILPTAAENFAGVLSLAEYFAVPIRFTFPDPLPALVEPDTPTPLRVTLAVSGAPVQAGSVKIMWRPAGSGGAFSPVVMSLQSGSTYIGDIPGFSCGGALEYYIEASTTTGGTERSPTDAPTTLLSVSSSQAVVAFDDACEAAAGWTVGAPGDNATAGLWGNMAPQATSAQPGADHSASGTRCWVTDGRAGAALGTYDVDGGDTSLTTPTFSAAGSGGGFLATGATFSYWVWYSNNLGGNADDTMPVLISNDNGATWMQADLLTASTSGWVNRTINIGALLTPTATMKVRFVARDRGLGSVVEAAVDDVRVALRGCPRNPADINGDGVVDLADFFEFLNCFDASEPCADIDGQPGIDLADFFLFLNLFDVS